MKFIENIKAQFREMREQARLFRSNIGSYWNYGSQLRKEYNENRRVKNGKQKRE